MSACPKCETPLEDDFGIVNCANCGVVCFVNLEGEVQLQEEYDSPLDMADYSSEEESPSLVEEVSTEEDFDGSPEEDTGGSEEPLGLEQEPQPVEDFDEWADPVDSASSEEKSEWSDSETASLEGVDDFEDVNPDFSENLEEDYKSENFEDVREDYAGTDSTEPETSADLFEDSEQHEDVKVNLPPIPSMTAKNFLEGLEVFSSETEVADLETDLFFDMTIEGIYNLDIKKEVFEYLEDSRLGISLEDLEAGFSDQQLVLTQVRFVQAFIIYKRVLRLGLSASWIQKEMHELGDESTYDDGTQEGSEEDYYEDSAAEDEY